MRYVAPIALAVVMLAPLATLRAQQRPAVPDKPTTDDTAASTARPPAEPDPMEEIRRTTAINMLNSLADEARSFRDQTLRARVQARAADALWETDRDKARELFRRAWDAAVAADADGERRVNEERKRQIAERGSFSMRMPPSLRTEVLRLAARREGALGEEFLKRMTEEKRESATNASESAPPSAQAPDQQRRRDPMEATPEAAKRLRLAIQLLEDGSVEQAIKFADPALGAVSAPALEFLARLRRRDPAAADFRYARMLTLAALDAESDANTVSMLGSYVFTPSLYVTFSHGGGWNSNSWGRDFPAPDDLPAQLRTNYFKVAADILLRPMPPPDQDRSSAGRGGTYAAIARLLPLFEQYAPDRVAALRTKLSALTPDAPESFRNPRNEMLTAGLVPEDSNRDRIREALDGLDRAKNSEARDSIYVTAALEAMRQKDPRVDEFVSKIENTDLRNSVRAYVDLQLVNRALEGRDAQEALRVARSGGLPPIQKTWALTEIAKLLSREEPGRAIELLEEAESEVKRIDAGSTDRVRALVAIATQLFELDRPRTWELMNEVVRASNAADGFTGEDGSIVSRIQTRNSSTMNSSSAESFDLNGLFAKLAREDLSRASELARAFKGESPRATATIAVSRAVLAKKN